MHEWDDSDADDDAALDDDFPSGDGTADMTTDVVCPYCGEENLIALDPGSGTRQEYVEDCPVCCRAWTVTVRYDHEGAAHVSIEPADAP